LVEEVKSELSNGRNVQVFAVYTQKRDVTRRLQELLRNEGIRAEVLTAETPPEQREVWYERQLRNGMQVCICHPKLVQTGLDLLAFPTIFFVQTGYSIYTLRQASRRSWRKVARGFSGPSTSKPRTIWKAGSSGCRSAFSNSAPP
jgi:superfamily II DNA or RNA helicase